MKHKIFIFFILIFLNACAQSTALLGPAITIGTTGNVLQAGLSYGTNEMITAYTGKTPIENLQEINLIEKRSENIKKNTLESEDFYFLVKSNIDRTNKILKQSNQ